ncbi:MAG TPA: hypothetical protein VIB79_04850 [Candidatus Binatia bacterium]
MDNHEPGVIKFTRNELYEKIWNTPTTKLARDFGLSDVALGKICKKHSIPKSPLGYWAKLAHGKTVARPPLPNIDDQQLERIEIRKRPLFFSGPKPQANEQQKEAPIPIPERLTSPHPLVRSTIDALKNSTLDETGILRSGVSGCLNVRVGRQSVARAMRLMDTLIKALEARGSKVSVMERDRTHQTCVKILDETIEIELREGLNRKEKQFTAAELREREKYPWLRDRKEYEFYPSGNFVFTILGYYGEGLRKVWSDGKRQRLENCLNSIIAGLGSAAEGEKALRLAREQRERERQEEQRRRWEVEERRRKEEEKIKHLGTLVANWNQSRTIREFLSEVEKAAAGNPAKETDNLSDWLSWAHAYADSIDPIHLTFNSSPAAGQQ